MLRRRAAHWRCRRALHSQEAIEKKPAGCPDSFSGGYVSENEVGVAPRSASKQAELMAAQARLSRAALEVDDYYSKRRSTEKSPTECLIGAFARPSLRFCRWLTLASACIRSMSLKPTFRLLGHRNAG